MLVSKAIQKGQIRAHYKENFVPLPTQTHAHGRQVFIQKSQLQRFKDTFARRETNFNLQYIYRQIWSLKGSGYLSSLFNQHSSMSRVLTFEGGNIKYAAFDGDIYIEDINITGPLSGSAKHPAGVYKINKDETGKDRWKPDENESTVNQIGHIKSKNLAVNGYSEGLQDAANYMPKFITHGFGEASLNRTYALFYVPTSNPIGGAFKTLVDSVDGKEMETAKKLSVVFEQLSQKQQELNLTVLGSGHYVFKSALKKACSKGVKLPNVTVYYANSTANLSGVDMYRRKAGMKLSEKPPLVNPASLQQQYLSGNILSAPEVAVRAKPSNTISTLWNTATSLPTSLSVSLLASLTVGSQRPLERDLIQNTGEAVQSGAKLVWSNVHKMMVKA